MRVLSVRHPETFVPERTYALDVVLGEFLGLEYTALSERRTDVEISLTGEQPQKRLVLADVFFRHPERAWLTPVTLPATRLRAWDVAAAGLDARLTSARLPVVYGEPLEHETFAVTDDEELRLGLDVFGTAFFMLTRYEERVGQGRDAHGRFPAAASVAAQAGILERPIVNEYVEVLWSALARLWPRLTRRKRSFEQLPSHDVDVPRCPTASAGLLAKRAARDLVTRRDAALALRRVRAFSAARAGGHVRDVCDTFDAIMEWSERLGLRSAFYVIAGGTTDFDPDYSLDDPWIRRLLRRIHDRGHEIGLHPSYGTMREAELLASEFRRLREACAAEGIEQESWGARQHFLRWENPTTWRDLDEAGLAYDSTLTFPERAGFRSGTCYEHTVFDLERRRPLALRERPLVVMEVSLLRYGALSPDAALRQIVALKSNCRLFDGDFTLLWHNDGLIARRERAAYRAALAA